ncbi:MAG: hypothetical protein K0S34_2040 [Bacillales bacterium]|jgi:uncharacterized membrane protein YccC|nr:hypothetical protein [Bacillales bacterium]
MKSTEKMIISIFITFIVCVGIGLSLQDIINYKIVFIIATLASCAVGLSFAVTNKLKAKI